MLFNEQAFLFVFLPVTLLVLVVLRKCFFSNRVVSIWTLVCSLFFYGFYEWKHLPVLLISFTINYIIGRRISSERDQSLSLIYLTLGILLNLSVLGIFKYSDFCLQSFSDLSPLGIALPLAISFFTFQQIAFLADLRGRKFKCPNFLDYALFVSFFPQLIAGPIVRSQVLLPQLNRGVLGQLSKESFWVGVCLFSIGIFKKAYFADGIRPMVEPIFARVAEGGSLAIMEAWIGATAFGMQIYFDFSAYSDMAVGLGLIFGLTLPINFNSPYKAKCVIEFWRRWHITLSEFLRDYLYKPLGGNRFGFGRGVTNVFIVMAIGGLWHGAGWTFVIWGLFHAVLISCNHLFRALRRSSDYINNEGLGFMGITKWLLTFCMISMSWVFFRCENLNGASEMISSMLGLNGIDLPRSIQIINNSEMIRLEGLLPNKVVVRELLPLLVGLLALVSLFPNSNTLVRYPKDFTSKLRIPPLKIVVFSGVLLFLGIKASFESIIMEFIYFKF